jgi:hypothetical protein
VCVEPAVTLGAVRAVPGMPPIGEPYATLGLSAPAPLLSPGRGAGVSPVSPPAWARENARLRHEHAERSGAVAAWWAAADARAERISAKRAFGLFDMPRPHAHDVDMAWP